MGTINEADFVHFLSSLLSREDVLRCTLSELWFVASHCGITDFYGVKKPELASQVLH